MAHIGIKMKKFRFDELEVGKCYTDSECRDLIFVKMRNDCLATFHLVDYDEDGAGFETNEEIYLTQSECCFYD